MDLNIYYNNKVLSAQEREEFRIRAEETIEIFKSIFLCYWCVKVQKSIILLTIIVVV